MLEISAAALLLLLATKELLSVSDSPHYQRLSRLFYLPITGLIITFVVSAVIRVGRILS